MKNKKRKQLQKAAQSAANDARPLAHTARTSSPRLVPLTPLSLVAALGDAKFLTAFVIAKVLSIAVLLASFYLFDGVAGLSHEINLWNRWHAGAEVLHAWYLPFANWDGQHYVLLADWSYDYLDNFKSANPESYALLEKSGSVTHSWAFFPLYPMLIRGVAWATGNVYAAAFALNILLSYLFCAVFYAYASHFLSSRTTVAALVVMLAYPVALFMTVFYSEALFLLLLFAFLYCYEIKKSYVSILFALLLPLARGQAVFVVVALLIVIAVRRWRGESLHYGYEASNLLAFAGGALLYLTFFQVTTGSPFAGIEAQGSFVFGNQLANIINPGHFLLYLLSASKSLFGYTHAVVDKVFVVASLVGIIIVAKARRPLWLVFYILLLYPVAAMGAGGSFARFSLLCAPFFILALSTLVVARPKREAWMVYLGIIFAIVQIIFTCRFALNMWVA